ncbi:hypothetical protein Pmani_028514 [Petrolisthes manimaculis]|uniref:DDE-1 domain-containing protein n=1 Tax=Petrolisthes manimaculis TaxID=1843537 RepID=A0AAE1TVM0_9EUCA|nr:hypothetical protein Pmani_028514 [Petrolisthes manimaculis]
MRYQDFSYQILKEHMINDAPAGTLGLANPSGWMNNQLFPEVLKHFIKYTSASKENPALLICDNHESHLSVTALDIAKDNGVTILSIHPHCNHKMQPLDVAMYGPFKSYYAAAMYSRLLQKPGIPLTIYDIGSLVDTAFKRSMTPLNITSGFKRSGIFPFDDNVFDDSDFSPSVVTDRPWPEPVKPVMNPEAGPSHENGNLPASTNGHDFQSPQEIRGYPKAAPRKETGKGRKRGRSMIATDTPEKEALAQSMPQNTHITQNRDANKDNSSRPIPKKLVFKEDLVLSDHSSDDFDEVSNEDQDFQHWKQNPKPFLTYLLFVVADLPPTVRTSSADIPGTSTGTLNTPSREQQQPESFMSTVKQELLSPHKLLGVKSVSSSPSHKYYSADKKTRLANYGSSSSSEQDPLAESPAAQVHELLVHDSEYGDPIAEEEVLPERRYLSDEDSIVEEDPLGTTLPPDPLATYDSCSSKIIGLKKAGHQTKKITELLGVAPSTVSKYMARFRAENTGKIPSQKPRSGRPRKISQRSVNVLKRSMESTPGVSVRALKKDNPEVFGTVSERTLYRRVQELGNTSHKTLKKPLIPERNRGGRDAPPPTQPKTLLKDKPSFDSWR